MNKINANHLFICRCSHLFVIFTLDLKVHPSRIFYLIFVLFRLEGRPLFCGFSPIPYFALDMSTIWVAVLLNFTVCTSKELPVRKWVALFECKHSVPKNICFLQSSHTAWKTRTYVSQDLQIPHQYTRPTDMTPSSVQTVIIDASKDISTKSFISTFVRSWTLCVWDCKLLCFNVCFSQPRCLHNQHCTLHYHWTSFYYEIPLMCW